MTKAESEIALVETNRIEFEAQGLPEYMWEGVQRYLLYGVCTGDFLQGVLENSLARAGAHADRVNQQLLFEWAGFLFNGMPKGSWGSVAQVDIWRDKGGLLGTMPSEKDSAT